MMQLDSNSVITACSKCQPASGEDGPVHKLAVEGERLVCTNAACRHDWTNWGDAPQTKEQAA